MDVFASLTGDDDNDGMSLENAFATIQRGVEALSPGDTLRIVAGMYVEHVRIGGKGSTDPAHPSKPIHLRPHHKDDAVVIDCAVNAFEERQHEVFREPGNDDWRRVGKNDLWVSRDRLEQGIARGAFLPLPAKTGMTLKSLAMLLKVADRVVETKGGRGEDGRRLGGDPSRRRRLTHARRGSGARRRQAVTLTNRMSEEPWRGWLSRCCSPFARTTVTV